jgi:hypothetical protein
MYRLLLLPLSACALTVPSPPVTRRAVVGGALAAAAASASPVAASAADVPADAKVVPKSKVGVTPGGVKYFDKAPGSCSPFNPCVPQAGDFVKSMWPLN